MSAPVAAAWLDPIVRQTPAAVLLDVCVEPHPAAAAAATKRVVAVPLHLDQLDARDRLEQRPRRFELVAAPADTTVVVIRHRHVDRTGEHRLAEPFDVLGQETSRNAAPGIRPRNADRTAARRGSCADRAARAGRTAAAQAAPRCSRPASRRAPLRQTAGRNRRAISPSCRARPTRRPTRSRSGRNHD